PRPACRTELVTSSVVSSAATNWRSVYALSSGSDSISWRAALVASSVAGRRIVTTPPPRFESLHHTGLSARVIAYPMAAEENLALNEALFRETNERVEERVRGLATEDEQFAIFCECASLECKERITLSKDEYEFVRSDSPQ